MVSIMKWSVTPCILISLILPGCAGLSARLPDVQQADLAHEQTNQEKALFQERKALQARLMPIADRILAANTELCRKTGLDIGVITHTEKSYPKRLRPL